MTTLPLSYEVPAVDPALLAAFVAERYGFTGRFAELPGERDRNFRLIAEPGGGAAGEMVAGGYVVKVAGATEQRAVLELQDAALARLEERAPTLALPRVVPALTGERITELAIGGQPHLVRMLTWVPGVPLATVQPRTRLQFRTLGSALAQLHAGLDGFDHPAANRTLKWDLGQAGWVEGHWDRLPTAARRQLAARMFRPFRDEVLPRWTALPQSVIYGDANDYNVLVAEPPDEPRPVVSLIDFGDMVRSATIADLAIAISYAALDQPDPLAVAAIVVEGYAEHRALTDAELAALYPSVCARLVVSAVNAAVQRAESGDNEYLFVSEAPVWRLLERLAPVHPRFAHYRLRAAAGLAPCPLTARVQRWIETHRDELIPPIAIAEGVMPPRVDLSVGSEFLDDYRLVDDEPALSRRITATREAVGARVAVGEYDEPRLLYTSELFRTRGVVGDEWRTIHLGLDLFTGTGCPVRTPVAGVVVGVQNNAGPRDYGPTIIVEHRVADADGPLTFWTLYGHLDAESLTAVHPGKPLAAGAPVGRVGGPHVNGGWSPHLHFQLVVDLLDRVGEFPGVARPSDREVWKALSPAPHQLAAVPDTRRREPLDAAAIRARRDRHLGRNLSVSYHRPLHIVRGWMQHLFDAEGRRFLDAVNNVPHVGHCHPAVVAAGQRQMAVLNTNTRYLHETVVRYAERLTQLLPEPLSVCYFVNSGSEANELALRLAATHTGRRGVAVIDGAYHGNTDTLVSLSPYTCEAAGGRGMASRARKLRLPDCCHRGELREGFNLGERWPPMPIPPSPRCAGRDNHSVPSRRVGAELRRPGGPAGRVFAGLRTAGFGRRMAFLVSPTRQVGFGRVGTHFWGFETQGVTPDIVVMGKPAGNGHPLGIVVTTPEIAASFDNGMEFFSTFGGNPVSAAIGLAVLDAIFDEDLQARARTVGTHLLAGLQGLVDRHEVAGNARGMGLFVGLELVTDRERRTPNPRAARSVANRARELGVLLSTDGPDHNVLKIKPPLCFTTDDADLLLGVLDRALGEDGARLTAETAIAGS
ncbi:MAG: aminotransferase class III-fold pyridoxal phosphate-dependent enzyme [Gemmatimonadales bacterium]